MTPLTDYTTFESWVLQSYKIQTKNHTPPSSLMLTTLLAFWVAAKTKFPFELSRLIMTPPPSSKAAETSILAVGGEYNDTD